MKFLTTTLLLITMASTSIAHAEALIKVQQINTKELQSVAKTYLTKNLVMVSTSEIKLDSNLLLTYTSKRSKTNDTTLLVKNGIIAE